VTPNQTGSAFISSTNWREVEFRHLDYAIAVADNQSFVRAAEVLKLDQPFLSRQISFLEKRLGFKLFDRKKRPLRLTIGGQEWLREARQILSQAEQAIKPVAATPEN